MEAERKKKARLGDRLNKMFSKNETILLKLLAAGPADTRTLFSAVQHRMTEQGFYKCIRNLLAEEAITKEGRTLRVSQAYIRRSEELLLQMHRGYYIRAIDSVFSTLSEGDYVKLTAHSLQQLDQILLDHLFFSREIADIAAVLLYSEPEVFPVIRPAQSKLFLNSFAEQKKRSIAALTGTFYPKYRAVKELFRHKNTHYDWGVKPPSSPKADMFQLCGDYIFLVRLGEKTKKSILDFLQSDARDFIDSRDKHTIKIIRDRKLSVQLKRHFTKQIPRAYLELENSATG